MENYGFGRRNGAIDMLRGLTMFLMIFVNDFWTIGDVPHWLEHAATHEDAMGLADIVFPLFLFVVGLSIPYAIERRFQKLIPAEKTLGHILSRTFALLVMGVFLVNADGGMAPYLGCGDWLFKLLAILGFFLVWNAYPEQFKAGKWLRGAGIILLIALAGILGLIGWAYLFGAVAWLLCRKRTGALSFVWLALIGLNLLTTATRDGEMLLDGGNLLQDFARALNLGNGSSALMVVTGMLVAVQEKNFGREPAGRKLLYAALSVGILIGFGTAAHEDWIISKNIGTLPWCFYVGAIGITLYTVHPSAPAGGKGLDGLVRALPPRRHGHIDGIPPPRRLLRRVGGPRPVLPRLARRPPRPREMRRFRLPLHRHRLGPREGGRQNQDLDARFPGPPDLKGK